jgi:hypothetical protein
MDSTMRSYRADFVGSRKIDVMASVRRVRSAETGDRNVSTHLRERE